VKQPEGEDDWWGARIILESVHPDRGEKLPYTLYEEQIRLVRGLSEADARARAVALGKSAEQEYKNVYGKTVRWVFRGVLDIFELFDDRPKEGTEVYSSFTHGETQLKYLKKRFRVRDW
jgi:hypothetical protein